MKYILSFFLLFLFQLSHSQTIRIIDKQSNEPLEMVSIVGLPSNNLLSSNPQGIANISSLRKDSVILFTILGYKTLSLSQSFFQATSAPIVIKLEPSFFSIDEIVVAANRWEQDSRSTPHKITSISAKDFKFQNPQTAADLLGSSGEVFIQKSQQGGGSPMIRGFATNRLLYAVDGVRMNTAIFRAGNIQNVISLDPFAMEKVEILFGPGAILYGSDAIGGVMSFITKKPAFAQDTNTYTSGNASVRLSTINSELSGHLDLTVSTQKWASISSFSITDYRDLKMGKFGPDDYLRDSLVVRFEEKDIAVENENQRSQIPTAYGQVNFMQKVDFQPNKKEIYRYAFHFSETSEFDRFDQLLAKKNGKFRFAEWKYGPQKWQMHQLMAEYKTPRFIYDKVKINLAYQRFEESRINRKFQSQLQENQLEKVNAYSVNVDFIKKINLNQFVFYGLEQVINTVNSSAFTKNINTLVKSNSQSRYPNSNWYSNAIYSTYQWNTTEKLTFEGGIRINQFALSSKFDTTYVHLPYTSYNLSKFAISGSLGGVYRPTEKVVFSSHLSSGFRSPNVDDIGKFDDQSDGSVIVPNINLTSENAYNFDIGGTAIIKERVKIDVTLFYTYLNNALVRRDFRFNGSDSLFFEGETKKVEAIQNAASAYVYGFQAGMELSLFRNLRFIQQINFQRGEEELDNGLKSPSRHAAPLFSLSALNYSLQKFRLELNFNYSDEVSFSELNIEEQEKNHLYASDNNGRPYSPSWYTLNLKTQYKFNEQLMLNLGLENITNQRYRTYSSGIAAGGRNLVVSMNAKF